MDTINNILGYLDKLQGMPSIGLVFFFCIVIGYACRFIQFRWFNNHAIPLFVILSGCIMNVIIADPKTANMPVRVWVMRNLAIGGVVGFFAWLAHYAVLAKLEKWLVNKYPAMGDTAFFMKSDLQTEQPESKPQDVNINEPVSKP